MKNNIVCFWWGTWGDDYGVKYVNKLYNDLQKHTTLDYNFYCFTDKPEKLDVPTIKFKPKFLWNLNKFEAYNPEHGLEGKIFTFDLDTLLLDNIDDILSFDDEFITTEDIYNLKKAGGGIVGATAEYGYKNIWLPLINNTKAITASTGGAERFFFRKYLKNIPFFQNKYQGIYSYKRDGIPEDARIIMFHGKPRPHEKGFIH